MATDVDTYLAAVLCEPGTEIVYDTVRYRVAEQLPVAVLDAFILVGNPQDPCGGWLCQRTALIFNGPGSPAQLASGGVR